MRIRPPLLPILAAAVVAVAAAALVLWQILAPAHHTLRISAGTPGGTYAAFADALAATVAVGPLDRIDIMSSAGANQNADRLAKDEADVGLIQSDTPVAPNTLIAARLFPEAFHLVARIASGIERVSDLRGRRIGLLPQGAGSNALFERLLAHYEIPMSEVTVIHGDLKTQAEALRTGDIDAFFMVVALGNGTIGKIIQSTPTQLVAIEQAEAMALFDPALSASTVPVGAYSGDRPVPDRPIQVVTVHSLLAVRRGLSDATVEALTRSLFENRQEMVRLLPQAAFISAPTDQDRLAFGIHPGANLYYREDDPLFIVEYAEPMALGVTALALLLSGLWQARVWLANARKNRADHYNLEIVEILRRVEAAARYEEFEAIRHDLFDIFRKVIVDLDNDRIEERSLGSFSFAWQVAASTLNHRQLVVAGAIEERDAPPAPTVDGSSARSL
ncbi:TAXI family TRAP transporter solute-binding subunit [Acuticoccus mangrovi]|uniref:TAXI family TRAP transporter solute-binding subunit n=1 Tax=Acuticoccus mangrovi TaxID=2796142 RepID=A0A934ILR5_9HYPH|nr:TAXI family TRAP transporter solute-binding subunit [Acuticoccus mangrovi]MBJ3774965.1 TAXI family TRAP transporter solute-binding subunit [Acuticoccus mangrovi]